MLQESDRREEASVEFMATTVRAVLEQVVGMSGDVATRAMETFSVRIDGIPVTHLDQALELRLGSRIDIQNFTRLKVIKAHFRTLEFYERL